MSDVSCCDELAYKKVCFFIIIFFFWKLKCTFTQPRKNEAESIFFLPYIPIGNLFKMNLIFTIFSILFVFLSKIILFLFDV